MSNHGKLPAEVSTQLYAATLVEHFSHHTTENQCFLLFFNQVQFPLSQEQNILNKTLQNTVTSSQLLKELKQNTIIIIKLADIYNVFYINYHSKVWGRQDFLMFNESLLLSRKTFVFSVLSNHRRMRRSSSMWLTRSSCCRRRARGRGVPEPPASSALPASAPPEAGLGSGRPGGTRPLEASWDQWSAGRIGHVS